MTPDDFRAYRQKRGPLRPIVSALDIPISVTFFNSVSAAAKSEVVTTLRQLEPRIRSTSASSKAALPWLKLATFGDKLSERRSLRHDGNMLAIHGIEVDYDGQQIDLAGAREALAKADIAALVYTSPSHSPEAPRWRLLCPVSVPQPPAARTAMVARINGLFGGVLARESFTLSQSYYYGFVEGNAGHAVELVDGRAIDLATELDAGAMGRPEKASANVVEFRQTQPSLPRHDERGGTTHYGRTALERECEAVRNAANGTKHDTLNKAAYAIGGLVSAGIVIESEAFAALSHALADLHDRAPCRDLGAARATLRRAFEDGKRHPRTVPETSFRSPPVEGVHPAQPLIDEIERTSANVAALQDKVQQNSAKAATKPLPVPDELMDVPGALRMFVDHCTAQAKSPQPFLALGAAICLVGTLAGRKYRTQTNLRTNVYIAGIADSGGGKDHAREVIKECAVLAGLKDYLGGEDLASGSSIYTALSRHPALLFEIDEFGNWLGEVLGQRAPPHKKQIAQRMKTLYSSAGSYLLGTEYADQSKTGRPREDIMNPHACFYCTTTPDQFWEAIAGASMKDGMIARMMIFMSPQSYPKKQRPSHVPPSESLLDALRQIATGPLEPGSDQLGNLSGLQMAGVAPWALAVEETPEAAAMLIELDDATTARLERNEGSPHVTSIVARHVENVTKLALIRAISRDPLRPRINASDVEWGTALSDHCMRTILREAPSNVAENEFDRRCNRVLKMIRRRGPISQAEIGRNGVKMTEREFSEVLRSLELWDLIVGTETQGGKAGRPTIRFTATTPPDVS